MSNFVNHSMQPERFMALAGNVLKRSFFDAPRVQAKRVYRDAFDGKRIALMKVIMDDKTELAVYLNLDRSQYRGKSAFSTFKRQVAVLLSQFSQMLEQGEKPRTLSSEDGQSHIFNLPALHMDGEHLNALVLGWRVRQAGSLDLNLLYIDAQQFRRQPEQRLN